MEWSVLESGAHRAQENMQIDAELLEGAGQLKGPCVRFYEWERPSITYGYFIDPEKFLRLDRLQQLGIDLARRPTGGGIVFHLFDMAFSALIPAHCSLFSRNTLDNYALINRAVLQAVEQFLYHRSSLEMTAVDLEGLQESCSHFCMARPTKYDVMWKEKKIAGAAQRKTKAGFLHQGTIALCLPDTKLLEQVLREEVREGVMSAMLRHTFALLRQGEEVGVAKRQLQQFLTVQLTALPL